MNQLFKIKPIRKYLFHEKHRSLFLSKRISNSFKQEEMKIIVKNQIFISSKHVEANYDSY